MSYWHWLFDPSGLTAHGFCLSWAPGLIALHAGSDLVIAVAYLSIPFALGWFVHQRRDLQHRWIIFAFVAFILACGTTHFFSVLTLWVPAYGIEGLIKLVTAVLSIATALLLWPLIPQLVALPSPAQLARVNTQLSERIAEQARMTALLRESEARGQAVNLELERRVAERTADLTRANEALEQVVADRTAALAQRDLLLKEVYHRVKNNLQIIDSLVVMQASRFDDPNTTQALLGLRSRIYALGLVHQQLMGSVNLRTFDIAPFLRELSANLLHGIGSDGVSLSVEADTLDVGLDFAIPLSLLATELVTNSLKHAFPDGTGQISVILRSGTDGEVILTVADNGRGSAGGNPSVAGIGLTIIEELVAQIEGTMTVHHDNGMTTEIRTKMRPQP